MISFVFRPKRRIAGKLHIAKNYSGKLQMDWEPGPPSVIPLGTSDKRVASDALNQLARERHMERQGLLAPRETREAAERPLDELLEAYLQDLAAKGRSVNTLAKYRSNITSLFHACGWRKLHCVISRDFCRWRAASTLSPKSKNDTLANVCGFMNWLKRQRMIVDNPLDGIDRADMRLVARFRRALSEEEQAKLLAAAPHFRAVIYLLALETGIRRNELQNLRVGDFTLDTPAPFVRLPASITKNRKEANMRLRPHVVEAVRSVFAPHALASEWVFHNRVPRISSMRRDLARAGIVFENEHGRIDLHALRVTFCTNLLNSGVHPRVAQELMRHSDIKLTMKNYTDPSQLPLAAAVDKLPLLALGKTYTQNYTQKHTQTGSAAVLTGSAEVLAMQSEPLLQSG